MAVVLTVTSTPQVISSAVFGPVASTFNSGIYRFTITPSLISTNAAYNGFHSIFGQVHGGVWLTDRAVELYTAPADTLCFSKAITWLAGQTITVTIDTRSSTRSVKIAGATIGNGTFTFTQAGPYFDSTTGIEVGQFGSGQFTFSGTVSSVDDTVNQIAAAGGTLALTGGAATLRAARKIPAAGGSLALTGAPTTLLTGKTINVATGTFALTGGGASFVRSLKNTLSGGALTLTGGVATIQSGPTMAVGVHGVDFQVFGHANRNASVTLNTQPTGSMIVIATGGKSSDITQTWTSNKGTITKLASVIDYPDYAGYGTQVGKTTAGGTGHNISVPVTAFDENTTFVTEVIGGRRVKTANANVANSSGGATATSPTVSTDGPAILIADWWGSSPTVPPFSGTPAVGTPYTATPNNGFTVLDSYLVNNQDGEVQACRAFLSVSAAGSYNVTWSHTPNQGSQTWLTAVLPAATAGGSGGVFALTGGAAVLRASRKVLVAGGAATLTGGAVTFTVTRTVTPATGSFALTGVAATLRAARQLAVSGTGYSMTGAPASLAVARSIPAAGGTLSLTGGAATLRAARAISPAGGTLALAGGATTLRVARVVAATGGASSLTGGAATLRAARVVLVAGSLYVLSGAPATIVSSKVITTGVGALTLTGGPATFVSGHVLDLGRALLTLVGGQATLYHARVLRGSGGALALVGALASVRASRRISAVGGAVTLTGGDVSLVQGERALALSGGVLVLSGGSASLVVNTPNTSRRPFSTAASVVLTRQVRVIVRS